jgi:two-component system chemotaxis response regulator CheY
MSIRHVFRVACAGLDPRDVRLIGIVFQHSQYNKYDFRMLDGIDPAGIDILIANPIDARGLDAIASLAVASRRIPSVSAVPRGAQATARYSVTIDRLTLQLLPILNRLVEEERLEPAAAGDDAPDCAAAPAGVPVLVRIGDEAAVAMLAATTAAADPSSPKLPPAGGSPIPADRSASEVAASAIALAARRDVDAPAAVAAVDGAVRWHGQASQAPARARLQVLVVDPSTAAQQQLVRALARMGLEVHCVSGVAAALKRVAERYTDLVITESGLSDGDGFDLIRRLRAQPAYRFTPVLLLRSRLHLMDATRARLAGEVTVLAKPLTRQALESVVRQALRKSVILDDLSELLAPH